MRARTFLLMASMPLLGAVSVFALYEPPARADKSSPPPVEDVSQIDMAAPPNQAASTSCPLPPELSALTAKGAGMHQALPGYDDIPPTYSISGDLPLGIPGVNYSTFGFFLASDEPPFAGDIATGKYRVRSREDRDGLLYVMAGPSKYESRSYHLLSADLEVTHFDRGRGIVRGAFSNAHLVMYANIAEFPIKDKVRFKRLPCEVRVPRIDFAATFPVRGSMAPHIQEMKNMAEEIRALR